MLSYFRINDPYRIIGVFLILILFKLPYLISGVPLTVPELDSMLLGEKLASGDALYTEIWDSTGPLSAFVYWLVYSCFGRSVLSFQLVAFGLIAIQSLMFNRMLLINKAFNENTYIPAAVYAIAMSLFFDFYTLSPVLMANTFVLFALNNIFGHIEILARRDDKILNIGLSLSIAALFYLPYFLYGIATLVVFALFTGTAPRRYTLFSYGYALPLLFLLCYFFFYDGLGSLQFNFLSTPFQFRAESLLNTSSLLIIAAVPALYLLLALVRINQGARLTNYQSRLMQTMFLWLIASLVTLLFVNVRTASNFIALVPVLAFYLTHYFLLIRRSLLKELAFTIFLALAFILNHGTYYGFAFTSDLIGYDKLLIKESPIADLLKGKSVLVLGNSRDEYRYTSHSTPYLSWKIASKIFYNLGYYDNLTHVYKSFTYHPPDLIIDHEGLVPSLFEKLPTIASRYQKVEGSTPIYQLQPAP